MEPGQFEGVIGRTYHDSTPWWPEPVRAPEGAPNIVIMVLDDVGFAHLGCYGSDIATPNMEKLAANGLRYTSFHTTAMCSPTRACAAHRPKPPRDQHKRDRWRACRAPASPATGRGCPLQADRHPGRDAEPARGLQRLRRGQVAPDPSETTHASAGPLAARPRLRPCYAFPGGYTHQFHPELVQDNHRSTLPAPDEGYHLTET